MGRPRWTRQTRRATCVAQVWTASAVSGLSDVCEVLAKTWRPRRSETRRGSERRVVFGRVGVCRMGKWFEAKPSWESEHLGLKKMKPQTVPSFPHIKLYTKKRESVPRRSILTDRTVRIHECPLNILKQHILSIDFFLSLLGQVSRKQHQSTQVALGPGHGAQLLNHACKFYSTHHVNFDHPEILDVRSLK